MDSFEDRFLWIVGAILVWLLLAPTARAEDRPPDDFGGYGGGSFGGGGSGGTW